MSDDLAQQAHRESLGFLLRTVVQAADAEQLGMKSDAFEILALGIGLLAAPRPLSEIDVEHLREDLDASGWLIDGGTSRRGGAGRKA